MHRERNPRTKQHRNKQAFTTLAQLLFSSYQIKYLLLMIRTVALEKIFRTEEVAFRLR